MTQALPTTPSPLDRLADDSVYTRIFGFMMAIGAVLTVVLWIKLDRSFALGFLIGSALSYFNLVMLKRAIFKLGEGVPNGKLTSAAPFLTRYLFRFILIAAVAYVIFKGSLVSVYGLFAGLFLPVTALMCEAVYEAWIALRNPG